LSPLKRTRTLVARAGLIGFAGIAMVGGNGALAAHEDLEFPAAIHAGTCEAPGDEVLTLDNLIRLPEGSAGEEDRAGAPGSQVIHGLPDDTEIDLTIDDLFADDHILAVFDAEGANIIACGPIGAYSYEDGDQLLFGLRSQGESPYSGVAILGDDADNSTDDVLDDINADTDDDGTDDSGTDDADSDDADSDAANADDGLNIEIYLVNNTPAPTGDPVATPVAGDTTDDTTVDTTDDDAVDDTTDDATDDDEATPEA